MARRPRILVIDDEIGMCKTLNDILADQGYRVEVAYSGREGLAKAGRRPPDLVILDLCLPDGDGLDLLARLQRAAPRSQTLVITAYGREWTGREDDSQDVLAYMEKPLDLERALELIRKAIKRGMAEDEMELELLAALGRRLRKLRREQRLSQVALSRKTSLNQSYISDVELGKRNVSLKNLYRLAQALEVELEELFKLDWDRLTGE